MDYSFGNWVKRRRKSLDLTQQELAQQLGCSVSLIVKIESDERRPSRQVAELLAKTLEIPIDQQTQFLKVARLEKAVDALEVLPPPSTPQSDPAPEPLRLTLPPATTPLLGRQHEIQAIIQQLQDPACRLLTLTGLGGVGKSSLALEVATGLQSSFSGGACFVSLAGTSTPEFIIPTIGASLKLEFAGPLELKTQLFQFLRAKELLLVLDNLEHLLGGIQVVGEMLEHAPHLKILTTSRENLNLRAEWVFEVQGLPVPILNTLAEIETNSAVQLFINRAKQSRVDFVVTPDNLSEIIHLCQLVEGLPLGLELAATWVRMMSIQEINREIEHSLDFLTSGARDLPSRHRSIRAVFDHSWDLLTESERRILLQLSVFSGGFARATAESVAGANIFQLSALVDKSLLRHTEGQPDRYNLHELIRQYVELKAQADPGEFAELHARHARHYANWLFQQQNQLQGPRQQEIIDLIGMEMDNLRSAWHWMVQHRQADLLHKSLTGMFVFHDIRNWLQPGMKIFEQAISALTYQQPAKEENDPESVLLGELMVCQGHMCWHLGHTSQARELLQRGVDLLSSDRMNAMLSEAALYLSLLEQSQGNHDMSLKFAEECVTLNRAQNRTFGIGYAMSNLGTVHLNLGDYESAYADLQESVATMQSINHPRGMAINLIRLGLAAIRLGKFEEAQGCLNTGLEITNSLHDRWGIGNAMYYLGVLALVQGNLESAEAWIEKSAKLFEEDGDQIMLAFTLAEQGFVLLEQKAESQARQVFMKALKLAFDSGTAPAGLLAVVGIAKVYETEGKIDRAYELATSANQHSAGSWQTRNQAAHLMTELAKLLPSHQTEESLIQNKSFEVVALDILNNEKRGR